MQHLQPIGREATYKTVSPEFVDQKTVHRMGVAEKEFMDPRLSLDGA